MNPGKLKWIGAMMLFMAVNFSFAQQEGAGELDEKFKELKSSSNNYQEYKVIKLQKLNSFWKEVQDYVAASRNELQATQQKVDELNDEVARLSDKIASQQAAVNESEHAATHISVLGIDILKDKFEAIFWITTAVLLLLLAGAIYQYKRSRKVTQRTRLNFMELQEELEELRRTSLEKERRLRRELQTERNSRDEQLRSPGFNR
jgi:septal ring factor EnvC (AmiA/AmiB activator)